MYIPAYIRACRCGYTVTSSMSVYNIAIVINNEFQHRFDQWKVGPQPPSGFGAHKDFQIAI